MNYLIQLAENYRLKRELHLVQTNQTSLFYSTVKKTVMRLNMGNMETTVVHGMVGNPAKVTQNFKIETGTTTRLKCLVEKDGLFFFVERSANGKKQIEPLLPQLS